MASKNTSLLINIFISVFSGLGISFLYLRYTTYGLTTIFIVSLVIASTVSAYTTVKTHDLFIEGYYE